MKKVPLHFALLIIIVTVFSGCTAIGDIFKAGVWVGVLIIVAIIAIIAFIVSKASGKD